MSHNNTDQVVVCGGGIIGVATAYYLTLQGAKTTLVERTGIACGASGKHLGFSGLSVRIVLMQPDWLADESDPSYNATLPALQGVANVR